MLVMTPQQLLMRLCSLVPAPGSPSRKYFGILAPAGKKRPETGGSCAHAATDKVVQRREATGADPRDVGRTVAMAVVEDGESAARYLAHTWKSTVYERATVSPELTAQRRMNSETGNLADPLPGDRSAQLPHRCAAMARGQRRGNMAKGSLRLGRRINNERSQGGLGVLLTGQEGVGRPTRGRRQLKLHPQVRQACLRRLTEAGRFADGSAPPPWRGRSTSRRSRNVGLGGGRVPGRLNG